MCYTLTVCSGLCSHVAAIEEIVKCAQCELQLETQFYAIEEEWSEQVCFILLAIHSTTYLTIATRVYCISSADRCCSLCPTNPTALFS